MKKGIIVGVGAALLIGGSLFGINNAFAADSQNQSGNTAAAQVQHLGKRFAVLNQHKDQIHQINQIREDRLELRKQLVEKRDQLLDLVLAAKNSGNKEQLKQAKAIRPQIKSLNQEIKGLIKEDRNEKQSLKQALKNNTGDGNNEFNQLISTQQQMNDKMQALMDQLDKMIAIFSSNANA